MISRRPFSPLRLRLALAILILAGWWGAAGCAPQTDAPGGHAADLRIDAPAQAPAGSPVRIDVTAGGADGLPVRLMMFGSYGVEIQEAALAGGATTFYLPGAATRAGGSARLFVQIGPETAERTIEWIPGPPVDPLQTLVGAKSIVADGTSWAMAVVIPQDQFGNALVEHSPIEIIRSHPDGRRQTYPLETEHLLAWVRLTSGTTAGRSRLNALAGHARGPEAELEEVAGWPVDFAVSHEPERVPADGRSLLTLRTTHLADRHGNRLPDGTRVTFVVVAAGGRRSYLPAQTIDGIAQASLTAPIRPETLSVRAVVYGVSSPEHPLVFDTAVAVGEIPLALRFDPEQTALVLTAGPFLADRGQFSPDGTLAEWQLEGPDGWRRSGTFEIAGGYAGQPLNLNELPAGRFRATVTAGLGSGRLSFTTPDSSGQVSP